MDDATTTLDHEPLFLPFAPGYGIEWLESTLVPQAVVFMNDLLKAVYTLCTTIYYASYTPVTILDVRAGSAAGSGFLKRSLTNLCGLPVEVTALEANPHFAKYAKTTFPEVTFLGKDLDELDQDASYDLVISAHTLQRVENPFAFTERLRRVAKEFVILSAPFDERHLADGHLNRISTSFLHTMPGVFWAGRMASLGWRPEAKSQTVIAALASATSAHLHTLAQVRDNLEQEYGCASLLRLQTSTEPAAIPTTGMAGAGVPCGRLATLMRYGRRLYRMVQTGGLTAALARVKRQLRGPQNGWAGAASAPGLGPTHAVALPAAMRLCNPIKLIAMDKQVDGKSSGEILESIRATEVQHLGPAELLLIEGEGDGQAMAAFIPTTGEHHEPHASLSILLQPGQRLTRRRLGASRVPAYARLEDFRRAVLLPHLTLPCDTLEIGAFTAPTLLPHETHLRILDFYPTDELRAQAKALGKEPGTVLEVDYVCRSDRYDEVIHEQFDLIIANHVFEHISRPIDWLNCCGRLLRSGGLLSLVIPDKKYNFDKFRGDTSLTQLLLEYFRPDWDAREFQALDAALYYDWGYSGKDNDVTTRLDESFLRRSLKEWHPGAHSHVFQAETFLERILKPILHLGLVDFGLLEFANYRPFGEFAILLQKGRKRPCLTERDFFRPAYDAVDGD